MNKHLIRYILGMLLMIFIISCASDKEDPIFSFPKDVLFIKDAVTCADSQKAYAALIADNMSEDGGRIKMIDGCNSGQNTDFAKAGKKGLKLGEEINKIDLFQFENIYYITAATSNEHALKLFSIKSLTEKVTDDMIKTVSLPYIPFTLSHFNNMFIAGGTDLQTNILSLISLDGTVVSSTQGNWVFRSMDCLDTLCVAVDSVTESLFKIHITDASITVEADTSLSSTAFTNITKIDNTRIAAWNRDTLYILSYNENQFIIDKTIPLPQSFSVTSVTLGSFTTEKDSHIMSVGHYGEKITIEAKKITNEVSDESPDSFDVEDEWYDTDISDDMDDIQEIPDIDETLTTRYMATDFDDIDYDEELDQDIPDEDIDDTMVDVEPFTNEIVDINGDDILWIATNHGNVIGYNLTKDGWAVKAGTTKEDGTDVAQSIAPEVEYFIRLQHRAQGSSTTSAANAPEIAWIEVIRGLPYPVTYELIYEGLRFETISHSGTFASEDMQFSDDNVLFSENYLDYTIHNILITDERSDSCEIPWIEPVIFSVNSILDDHTLNVEERGDSNWSDLIGQCYGDMFSYGFYPEQYYTVFRTDFMNPGVESIAREYSALDDNITLKKSLEDSIASFAVQRVNDNVITAQGTTIVVKIEPQIVYYGISSSLYMKKMFSPRPGTLLLFSPEKEQIVDYNLDNEEIVETYK